MINIKKILFTSALIIISTLIAAVLLFYNYAQQKINTESIQLSRTDIFKLKESVEPQPAWNPYQGEFTMLIIGSDERDGTTKDDSSSVLNDVTLLVHVVEDHSQISVISMPRDLLVDFKSCSDKPGDIRQFNSALSYGGADCVVNLISDLSRLEIPHAMLVNFASVVAITEIIEGIPVCLPSPLIHHSTGEIIAPEGNSTIQGMQALDFLRERKTIQGGGDLGRINNQQVFLKNLLIKLDKEDTLKNPTKIISLGSELLENVKVSDTLTDLNKIVRLGLMLREIGANNISFYTAPVKPAPEDPNRLVLEEEKWEELIQNITSSKTEPTIKDNYVSLPTLDPKNNDNLLKEQESNPEKEPEASATNSEGYYCGLGSGW